MPQKQAEMKRFVFIIFAILANSCFSQKYIRPVFDRTDNYLFHLDSVEVTTDSTFLYFTYAAEGGSWACLSENTFLHDKSSGKRYLAKSVVGIPFHPNKRHFFLGGKTSVKVSFASIGKKHQFNFIESEQDSTAFNIYGIDLNSRFDTMCQESELQRISNMASFYDSARDTIRAIEYKEKEIEIIKGIFGIKSIPLLNSLTEIAVMYDQYGYNEKAISIAKQEGLLHAELWGTSDWDYALYLRTLGQFYSNAKKYDFAVHEFEKSINLFESIHVTDNEYALALYFAAGDYYELGDKAKALTCQKKCIQARRQIGDSDGYINELYNILLTGNVEAIQQRIQIVEDELSNLPNFIRSSSLPIGGIYKKIASKYSLMDDNKNAIEYCNKALSVMDSNGYNNNEDYAELLGLKCKYQQRSGLKEEAISSGIAAKQLYESLNTTSLKYAELLGNLAWAFGLGLDFEKSIQLQTTAAKIYENAKDWISLAEVYNSISHYYQSAENLDDAERYVKKAIDILNEHDNAQHYINYEVELTGNNMINNPFALASINQLINTDKASFYQTLARIYQKKGDLANAINTELKHGVITKSMGDDQNYAVHLMTLSEYYMKNQQLNEAFVCAENSIQLLANDNRISLVLPKLQLANICFLAEDTVKAIHYAKEAVSASKSIDDKGSWISTNSRIAAQSVLSFFYWKKREYGKAEQCLSEELDYLRDFISKELSEMTTEQKQRLWGKYESNFLMYRNIVEKSNRNDTLLSKLYNYVLFSKNLLLDTDIQKDANRLEITWKDIQQQISTEDIAIEFISTLEEEENYHTYHALIIDKNNPSPKIITLYSETELEDILKTSTRNIRDIVGELIWKPILAQYSNAKNIYFSSDGIFHRLPIEYYNVNSTTNMFEHYNMYRLSSTKELVSEHSHKQFNSAVLYGGLDYNLSKETSTGTSTEEISNVWRGIAERGGFDPLFNTLVETQEIKDILDSKKISTILYTGEKGTEDSFRKLSNQNYSIIHLATHGMYVNPDGVEIKKTEDNFTFMETLASANDPVKEDAILTHSFLVMSGGNRLVTRNPISDGNHDGILTSKEISQLNLSGLDLVVLSACESALGDIDHGGVYGLQRGFKKSGANTILMSLEKVDDDATKILMIEFYRSLLAGKSKRQSLKDAQKHLRSVENGKYDDPKYWASFILLDGLD